MGTLATQRNQSKPSRRLTAWIARTTGPEDLQWGRLPLHTRANVTLIAAKAAQLAMKIKTKIRILWRRKGKYFGEYRVATVLHYRRKTGRHQVRCQSDKREYWLNLKLYDAQVISRYEFDKLAKEERKELADEEERERRRLAEEKEREHRRLAELAGKLGKENPTPEGKPYQTKKFGGSFAVGFRDGTVVVTNSLSKVANMNKER